MNAETETTITELEIWHSLLSDNVAARNNPESQHGALRKHAEVLRRLGIIDDGELIELNELADARYAEAAEAILDQLVGDGEELWPGSSA